MPIYGRRQESSITQRFTPAAVSGQRTRTLAEIPWLGLLPPEQRARLEAPYEDPDADQWDALVAADRSREADFARPSNVSRIVKPLAAAGVLAVMLLAVDAPRDAEHVGRGGSSATASGSITASTAAAPRKVPEENRVALTSRSTVEVTGTEASGRTNGKPRGGTEAPASPSTPALRAAGEPETPPLASATLPVVGEVEVPAPKVELPGVELPQLPPLQLPQLPQLPPLLPPSQHQ
jgi:hypothetical protein